MPNEIDVTLYLVDISIIYNFYNVTLALLLTLYLECAILRYIFLFQSQEDDYECTKAEGKAKTYKVDKQNFAKVSSTFTSLIFSNAFAFNLHDNC